MKRKKRIAVLMGGPSSEHEVSLATGAMVLRHLNRNTHHAFPVKIGKDGSWPLPMSALKAQADVAFIAMHGAYGEDGTLQSTLASFEMPYTGSDPLASALAMDKPRSIALLAAHGFRVPKSLVIKKDDPHSEAVIQKNFTFPVVIKPTHHGSSIGVGIARKKSDLKYALQRAFHHSSTCLVQQYIRGREVTCGVLEIHGTPIPLMPTEIIPLAGEFFDYHAKYNSQGSKELTPPLLPSRTIRKIQHAARSIHSLLGCSGMSRTDMIIDGRGPLFILETNTIPGLTPTSILPAQARALGIEFPQLLELIIKGAERKK